MSTGDERSAAYVARFRRWAFLLAAVFVAGYAGNALAGQSGNANWNATPQPYTMTYLGRPLHCLVTEDGAEAGQIGALACDFVRFWRHK